MQGDLAAGDSEAAGDRQQPEPQALGFPTASVVAGQRKQLSPGGQVERERDQGAPDLVLGEVVQRQVGQSGVLGDADAVLGAGTPAVPQLEVGQLPNQRANSAVSARSSPTVRAVSPSSTPPACDTTPEPAASTRTRGYDPLLFLT